MCYTTEHDHSALKCVDINGEPPKMGKLWFRPLRIEGLGDPKKKYTPPPSVTLPNMVILHQMI